MLAVEFSWSLPSRVRDRGGGVPERFMGAYILYLYIAGDMAIWVVKWTDVDKKADI